MPREFLPGLGSFKNIHAFMNTFQVLLWIRSESQALATPDTNKQYDATEKYWCLAQKSSLSMLGIQ